MEGPYGQSSRDRGAQPEFSLCPVAPMRAHRGSVLRDRGAVLFGDRGRLRRTAPVIMPGPVAQLVRAHA
jgi:hypothetical protein